MAAPILAPEPQVAVDPVLMQVVKNALDSVAEQMAVTLQYTAHSTVIREVLDFATALLDVQGRLVSQTAAAPTFVNALGPTLRFVMDQACPLSQWEEGDVFLVNDPYLGGSQHLPDLAMFRPIFWRGRLVGVAGCIAHHVDVGGAAPGSYYMTATEIFQEGLRIPPVRLYRRGELQGDIKRLLFANMRIPDYVWGDMEAQLACLRIGEQGFRELLDRWSPETIAACVEALLGYSERLMRAGLRKIPEGVYRFEDRLDDDGASDEPVRIAVTITVKGDEVIADFTGSSAQRPAPINCSLSMTTAVVHYCLVAAVGADVPVNEGCFRPVTVIAPEGSVINALPPAPVVGRMATLHRTCDAVNGALAQALPERIPAAYYGMSTTTMMSGIGAQGAMSWVLFEIQVGGWGGQSWRDGFESCSAMIHNPANTPIEMLERMHPVRIERYALREDSGGPGKHRGGMGIARDTRLLEGRAVITVLGDRMKQGPYGLHGGLEGGRTEIVINPGGSNERRLPSKITGVPIAAGEVFGTRTTGGGGWGDPKARDRDAVRRDLALGKISARAARDIYGLDDA